MAIELAHLVGDPHAETVARYTATTGLYYTGESEGAELHRLPSLAAAEKLRDRSWLSRALWGNKCVPRP